MELQLDGSFRSSSIASGTFPLYCSAMILQAAFTLLALFRKKPVEWTSVSSSAVSAFSNASAVLYLLNSAGVMLLTILSVLCADRIVATRS